MRRERPSRVPLVLPILAFVAFLFAVWPLLAGSSGGTGDVVSAGKAGGQTVRGGTSNTESLCLYADSTGTPFSKLCLAGSNNSSYFGGFAGTIWHSGDLNDYPNYSLIYLGNSTAGWNSSWSAKYSQITLDSANGGIIFSTSPDGVAFPEARITNAGDLVLFDGKVNATHGVISGSSTVVGLPATCAVGQIQTTTDTTKLCSCTATNVWKCVGLS